MRRRPGLHPVLVAVLLLAVPGEEETRHAERRLAELTKLVDAEVERRGDAGIAQRLADELGVRSDDLVNEKILTGAALASHGSTYDVSWGEFLIARTLAANAAPGVATGELLSWRSRSTGWGAIAAGSGLDPGEVARAVGVATRVALGRAEADGRGSE